MGWGKAGFCFGDLVPLPTVQLSSPTPWRLKADSPVKALFSKLHLEEFVSEHCAYLEHKG